MSWPCLNSPTHQHKWGAIHFAGLSRLSFIRACRYCDAIYRSTMDEVNKDATSVSVHRSTSKSVTENTDSQPRVSDIDPETGSIP